MPFSVVWKFVAGFRQETKRDIDVSLPTTSGVFNMLCLDCREAYKVILHSEFSLQVFFTNNNQNKNVVPLMEQILHIASGINNTQDLVLFLRNK